MSTHTDPSTYSAADFFDSVGPAYESAFESNPVQAQSIKWLLSQLPAHSRVLDIGCGTGRPVCSSLAEAGHDAVGIDVSGAMIDAANENVRSKFPGQTKFEVMDVRNYDGGKESWDAITVYFSLIAGVSQQDIRETFGRVHGWLKSGGIFVFATVPVAGNDVWIKWMGRDVMVSSLTAEESVDELKKVGFEILDQGTVQFMPKGVEAGICKEGDVWEEEHLWVYAKKA